jgi:hypothetical protein
MPESYWRGPLAALGLFEVCAFIVGLLGWSLGERSQQRLEAERTARHHGERTDEYIERACVGTERTPLLECTSKAIEASSEYQRAGYDLNAQEDMAKRAMRLFWATIITTGVAAWGIYYVRETLVEARAGTEAALKSVEVTREIGNRQLRAYVHFTEVNVRPLEIGKKPVFTFTAKNTGATPAYRVAIRSIAGWTTHPHTTKFGRIKPEEVISRSTLGVGSEFDLTIEFNEVTSNEVWKLFIEDRYVPFAAGVIIYRDVFGVTRRTSFRGYVPFQNLTKGGARFTVSYRQNKST